MFLILTIREYSFPRPQCYDSYTTADTVCLIGVLYGSFARNSSMPISAEMLAFVGEFGL